MKRIFLLIFTLMPFLGQSIQRAYIGRTDAVSVVNTTTNAVVDTISIASGDPLLGIAITSDERVLLTRPTLNDVVVIDGTTNTEVTNISVGDTPSGIVITPDGTKAYIANSLSDTVSVINLTSYSVIATIPVGNTPQQLAITSNGEKIYVVNSLDLNMSVIEVSTNQVIDTVAITGSSFPVGIVITPDISKAYITDFTTNEVIVMNLSTNTVITTISVGANPEFGIVMTPDGARVYVENGTNISVISTATNTITDTIAVGTASSGISVTPDGSKVYVANQNSDAVFVIGTDTNTIADTITGLTGANIVAITPPNSQVTGSSATHISIGQKEFFNTINWTLPTDITTVYYQIFRDIFLTDLLVSILDPNTLTFEEHNLNKNREYIYRVVAIDSLNNRYLLGSSVELNFKD